MQLYLGELLEELDKVYPESLTVEVLRRKIASDVDDTIGEAVRRELIRYPAYKPYITLGTGDRISLSIKGFELLNQIRIKKTIEKLDDSINKFNESSDKSSKKMIDITFAIYVFTLIAVASPIIETIISPFKGNILLWTIGHFVGIIIIAGVMIVFYKNYEKKTS